MNAVSDFEKNTVLEPLVHVFSVLICDTKQLAGVAQTVGLVVTRQATGSMIALGYPATSRPAV
jgi:hypothetical protein